MAKCESSSRWLLLTGCCLTAAVCAWAETPKVTAVPVSVMAQRRGCKPDAYNPVILTQRDIIPWATARSLAMPCRAEIVAPIACRL